jgi:hypothetical protein
MSYVIATNELSLADRKVYINNAVEAGIARALVLGIARNREELVVREALAREDLGTAATGWTTNEFISMAIPAANAWCSAFSAGALPGTAFQLARTKLAVFYKFADTEANPIVTGVRFRVGTTGATTKAVFSTQLPTEAKMEPDVYLTEPVIYDPEDWLYIEIYPTGNVGGNESIPFGCFIVERVGGTVS